jgi:hypothetical protein
MKPKLVLAGVALIEIVVALVLFLLVDHEPGSEKQMGVLS